MALKSSYPGTPSWVKAAGVVLGLLVLLVAVIVIAGVGGPHGPGRHAAPGESGGHGWGLLTLLAGIAVAGAALNWGWLVERGLPRLLGRSSITAWLSPRTRTMAAPMIMSAGLRKFVLFMHVVSSVGSLGAVTVFLVLAATGLASQDAQLVRTAYIANAMIAWYVVLPFIVAALLIGIIQALGTPWGLFRHYWVLAKLGITLVTLNVLLSQLDGIGHVASVAATTHLSSADLLELRHSMRAHAAGGLVVLLVLVMLSIYKPRGLTRYGWRNQHEQREAPHSVGAVPRPDLDDPGAKSGREV